MSHQSNLHRLLCLDGLWLDRLETQSDAILAQVRSPRTTANCPNCHRRTQKVHKRLWRTAKHARLDDHVVYLHLLVRQFKCKTCGLFRETFPGIDRRRTTAHYRQLMLPKVRNRSFRDVATEYQVSTSNLLRAAVELVETHGPEWPQEPFALGIDEHSFAGRDLMITLTDVTHRRLLGLLPDDRQSTLRQWVRQMPTSAKNRLTAAVMDMKQSYRSVVEQELPGLPIVTDKFHVIQHLNWHLDQLRRVYTSSAYPLPTQLLEKNREELTTDEQEALAQMFQQFPSIQELWKLKEYVRVMYRIRDPNEARMRYQVILDGLRGDGRARWRALYDTFRRWQPCVLNYFTHRVTNAYTEGVHTRIKLLKWISYGFRNKTNYIAKMTIAFLPLTAVLELLNRHPIC